MAVLDEHLSIKAELSLTFGVTVGLWVCCGLDQGLGSSWDLLQSYGGSVELNTLLSPATWEETY